MTTMFLSRFLAFFGLAVAGCSPPPAPEAPAATSNAMRYLALGDSYTIGERVNPAERWPVQLANRLREEKIDVADPQIIAKTGWTTGELLAAMDADPPKGPFALVSLLIGVNNQYRGGEPERYRPEFVELLKRSIQLAGGEPSRVLVLSIPDWGVTPFAEGNDRERIAAAIDKFNTVNREESTRAGVHYVDVTPVSREAPKRPSLVAVDGLHPSAEMYAEWVKLALPEARKALSAPATRPSSR